ncbi:hemagluttinin family protein, partial [Trypanosoma theileri]
MTLRVGMNETVSYDVCYRVVDSGFAKVGVNSIVPVQNSPNTFTVTPTPTLQGQRLTFDVKGFAIDSKDVKAPSVSDAAMLVKATRLCWETETMSSEGILASTSNVKTVTSNQSTWLGHVPSLGPNALPVSSFPMKYTLCYRETGQNEYVIVPFPLGDYTMEPANPSTFATVPSVVTSGMFGIQMTFPGAKDGDVAYIVAYAGTNLTTNSACDDPASRVLTPTSSSFPVYAFALPPLLTMPSLVVCYVRDKATVAEVPQLLALGSPNPSGYVTDAPDPTTLKQRQYIGITFTGVGLDPATDSVVFTDVACANATAQPPVSASFVRRMSELTSTSGATSGTSVKLVVQFVSPTDITAHVCYRRGNVWTEIGSPLSIAAPQPTILTLTPTIGVARVGQH